MEVSKPEGDEFYEEIEAPKFVDFTTPDHYSPDDRYWFCLRVGMFTSSELELIGVSLTFAQFRYPRLNLEPRCSVLC